ncbi:Uncharacterised protein at_DN0954, partial [Pycnogonum litorale]
MVTMVDRKVFVLKTFGENLTWRPSKNDTIAAVGCVLTFTEWPKLESVQLTVLEITMKSEVLFYLKPTSKNVKIIVSDYLQSNNYIGISLSCQLCIPITHSVHLIGS